MVSGDSHLGDKNCMSLWESVEKFDSGYFGGKKKS
jgi:hypothetical protein